MRCACSIPHQEPRLVVITGGPGAGKTAVLEVVRRDFCEHVVVLPESASILFSGGFPRRDDSVGRRAAQRAIYRVQRELEQMAIEEAKAAVILCDRGTVDGLAYWPNGQESFWREIGTTPEAEKARYATVIHLQTPRADGGYNHVNPVRRESAEEAAEIDRRLAVAWAGHPRRFVVDHAPSFVEKLEGAMSVIREEVPACCRVHHGGSGSVTATG